MPQLLSWLHARHGIDRTTVWMFLGSVVLFILAVWIRLTAVRFNITTFYMAGGVIVVNAVLAYWYTRHSQLLGYIFAGSALFTQVLFLILLWQSAQGGGL